MQTEKLIIYGVAAFIAYSVIRRKGIRVNGGIGISGQPAPYSPAQQNRIDARTALDLAYGIKGLFGGGGSAPSGVNVPSTMGPNESIVSPDELHNTDDWAANPYNPY